MLIFKACSDLHLPKFGQPMRNVSSETGHTASFTCEVANLGSYKVNRSWKSETFTFIQATGSGGICQAGTVGAAFLAAPRFSARQWQVPAARFGLVSRTG